MKMLNFTYGVVLLGSFSAGSFLTRNGVSTAGFVKKEREICLLVVDKCIANTAMLIRPNL